MIVLSALAIVSAIGTFVEARYDAAYAQKMVYHSPYMYFIMALLCVNLINVMIDRLPWKAHHAGFIFAHIGIIVLIIGSIVTRYYGIDGSIVLDAGKSSRFVQLPETELGVYATFGDGSYKPIEIIKRDFLLHPPQKDRPAISLGEDKIQITDYYHYARREQKIVPSELPQSGPAVRIQLQNANVNVSQWILRQDMKEKATFDLGPARVVLADEKSNHQFGDRNEILLRTTENGKVTYEIFTKSQGRVTAKGQIQIADAIETGWMGLKLRLLKFIPKAREEITYVEESRPSGMTVSAIRLEYQKQSYWLGLNTSVRLFADNMMFLVVYRNVQIDLGFDMHLNEFNVGRYQGTNRAMSYQSRVTVPGLDNHLISMNEPLKYEGYTFYQASFQENENGEATTSILSVNKDPGRWVKYLGSLLIVLGTIIMFYFKRYRLKIKELITKKVEVE